MFSSSPRPPGRTPLQIGEHNLRVTLEAIRRYGPLTRAELARRSGLSGPGVTNILHRLGEDGLVVARRRRARSGPPVSEYAVVAAAAQAIGVALYGASGTALLLDLAGNVRQSHRFAVGADPVRAVAAVVEELDCRGDGRVVGVGIGTPDPAALPEAALRAALPPLPVGIERDCVAALFAERTFGVGTIEAGVMLIVLGDHIRAGFMFRGQPFAGVHGRAGSIGNVCTGPDRVRLDEVAGLDSLRAVMTDAERAALHAGGALALSPPIRDWTRNAAGHLLDAIVAAAGFLAPGVILVGGDVPANLVDELIRQMSVARGDRVVRPFITPWISPIRPTSLAGAGIAVGAALLPFFDSLLPAPTMPG